MRSYLLPVAIAVAGCVPQPELPSDTDTEGEADAGSHGTSDDGTGGATRGVSAGGTGGSAGTDSGPESTTDGETTGGCGDQACPQEPPSLLWTTEYEQIYGDGRCLDVTEDGHGGLFASFRGFGFESYSDVIAVDQSGEITAMGSGVDSGWYVGLASRAPGLFDWAATDGRVGIADESLANLGGDALAFDVEELRAMAKGDAALQYVARVSPSFSCVVRTGPDPAADSVPFPCADTFSRERLALDGMGNRYYFEPSAYRVLRFDPVGLAWGEVDGRWNRVGIDATVDPDGHVWIVGGLGSRISDLFGTFIAQHTLDLEEDPQWEHKLEDGTLWTAVAMTEEGPVVFGHEGAGAHLHAVALDFDGGERWTWSHEPAPQTYLDAVTVDSDGDLLACGVRYTGEQTPVGPDIRHPVFYKLGF